jgi:excisionase family DNA binding protein
MSNQLLKPKLVAQQLGISISLTYQLMRQGVIPCVRISHRAVRVRPQDLERYIQENISDKGSSIPYLDSPKLDLSKNNS